MGLLLLAILPLILAATTAADIANNATVGLAGGSDQYYCGRLEVFFDDRELELYSIIDAEWLCGNLGFPRGGAVVRLSRNDTNDSVLFGKVECPPSASSLSECTLERSSNGSVSEGNLTAHLCCDPRPRSLPVRLICPPCTGRSWCRTCPEKIHPSKTDCRAQPAVAGIVEVMVDGKWGPVAADGWNDGEATVVCGQLGYPIGSVPPAIEDIWPEYRQLLDSGLLLNNGSTVVNHSLFQEHECLDKNLDHLKTLSNSFSHSLIEGVECSGTESELLECSASGYGCRSNPSRRVAVVRCEFRSNINCSPLKTIRIKGSAVQWKGRVEMKVNKKWGTVCSSEFSKVDGNVACRSLGYGTVKTQNVSWYGAGVGKIHYSNISCTGREASLEVCRKSTDVSKCDHSDDVGIECNVPECSNCPLDYNVREIEQGGVMYPEVNGKSGWGLLCNNSRVPIVAREAGEVICRQINGSFFENVKHLPNPPSNYSGTFYSGTIQCSESAAHLSQCSMSLIQRRSCTQGHIIIFCSPVRADLVPDIGRLKESLKSYFALQEISKYFLSCADDEGCLSRSSPNSYNRKLLRFDSLVWNYGLEDFRPVSSDWKYHECHYHYHSMAEFAHYNIYYRGSKHKAAEGHKASFCLMDSECKFGATPQHWCSNNIQAISVNCGDLYHQQLDCQWVDITGLHNGDYELEVAANPLRLGLESDYLNNNATCLIRIDRVVRDWFFYPVDVVIVGDCWLSDH